ncbi:spherulation-specific family 4 protein [Actinosynnema sp. NPDC020468]|uniref:spherulation-specific family 4 protein n=1 Tax=Actinosynnema sp. NPDC020468 TaxID=3154488 RepID=UPI0033E3D834
MTRLRTVSARVGVALMAVTLLAPAPAGTAAPEQRAAVPAYWSPATAEGRTLFRRLAQNRPTTGIIVVNGSESRPEAPFDRAWADAIGTVHDSGAKALVYVDTGYLGVDLGQGAHPTRTGLTTADAWEDQVEQDVEEWYDLYGDRGVDGVFLDQTLPTCGPDDEHVDRYAEIADRIREEHPDAYLVINPGRPVDRCYADVADTILSFEGDFQSYLAYSPPAWERATRDRRKFWHLVYDVPTEADMATAVARSKTHGAGYVYVTERAHDPFPWNTLASYWDGEIGQVAGVADHTAPTAPRYTRTSAGPNQAVVRWNRSRDNVAVVGYEVLRDGAPIGTTYDTAYTATDLEPGHTYTFTVRARDAAGNVSPLGAPSTVTTPTESIHTPLACLTPTTATYTATFLRDFTHRRVFIDSDDNATTGFPLPDGRPQGMDHMVEDGTLYRYTGPGWNWTRVEEVEETTTEDTVTWHFPTPTLSTTATRQVVVFNGYDGTDDYSPPLTVDQTPDCAG